MTRTSVPDEDQTPPIQPLAEEAKTPEMQEKPVEGSILTINGPNVKPKSESIKGDGPAERVAAEVEDESKYPSGFKLTLLTFGLCLSMFVIALDNTIIATAIPTITTRFNSLNDVGWYGSSYLLTTTSLQPSFGKIYTYFNVKWTFVTALIIFEVGSVVCATAVSSKMLIVGRAIAGTGAAALFSGAMTIIGFIAPLRKRSILIAALSSMFGTASIVGPILGGALTDRTTWRWCFWINLPFGGLALLTVFFFFDEPERAASILTIKERLWKVDFLGAGLLIPAIVCMLLALQWGGTKFPWHDPKIIGLFVGFGLLVIAFMAVQIRQGEDATIPLRIVKQRTVLASSLFTLFLEMGLYTHAYYLPFYFQAVKGTTAEASGIRTTPYLVSSTVASIVVGVTISAFGFYTPFMILGAILFTIGAGLLFLLHVDTSAGSWIGYQVLCGFGAGAGAQIPFIAVQVVLNSVDMPSGNAFVIFCNTLGPALSVSIAQNIFANGLVQEVPKHTTGLSGTDVLAIGATHLREAISADQLQGVLEAYSLALNKSFVLPIAVGVACVICALFMEWKSVKGKNLMGGGA